MTELTEASSIHQLAVETDTELARLWVIESRYRRAAYDMRERMDDGLYRPSELPRIEQQLAEYEVKVAEARADAQPGEALYRQHLWSRFYLCTASNGHIHNTMACSTTYSTTQFAWLPQLSGLTEAEAVADQGEILCSVCFPSAPVAWTSGVSKAVQAERDERAALKAERAAKKAAKALFVDDPERGIKTAAKGMIKTTASAKSYLTDAMAWQQSYIANGREGNHPSYPEAEVYSVADALAERTQSMAHLVLAAAAKRAQKRGW